MATAETAEEISKKPEVRQALSQTTGPKLGEEKVKAATKDKFWFVTHALLILGCAILYYLVGSKLIPVPQNIVDLTRRFLRGAVLVVIVLAIAKAISIYAIGRLDDAATRFTLRRIEHLLVALVVAVIVIGVVFVNWYTALISVGIGSVIVGLAVQTPMTSFLGWIYILVRHPYRVGDRILSRPAARSGLNQNSAPSQTSRRPQCRAEPSDVSERRRTLGYSSFKRAIEACNVRRFCC